jgi:hypothetical protein
LDALAALEDMQQRQAALYQERDALRESGQRWAENVRCKEERIVAAEAKVDEALRVTAAAAEVDTARASAAEAALADTRERAQRLYESYCETVAALADANRKVDSLVIRLADAELERDEERQRADDYADHLANALSFAHPITGTDHDEEEAARAALDRHTTPAPTEEGT